ncbi:diguanylate cyclase, partial [Enterobacter kobei]|uniref:diguanylate cyclase domain-containing protein n=1 Tax=Enterobacter kobei TaxID=208224 RepID=UPI00222EB0E9
VIVHEDTREPVDSPVDQCLRRREVVGLTSRTLLLSRQGQEFGIEDSSAPIVNEAGELLGAVLVFHDVTEQRRLSGEVAYRASHDALTGLVNRVEFESRLRRLLAHAREFEDQHALLYIDLDQFKLVNDACGHSVGDELLKQVGRLLKEAVRA